VPEIDWEQVELATVVWGSPVWRWGAAVATFFAVYFAFRLVRRIGDRFRPEGHPRSVREVVMAVLDHLGKLPSFAFAVVAGEWWLFASEDVDDAFQVVLVLAVALQLGIFVSALVRIIIDREAQSRSLQQDEDISSIGIIRFLAQLAVWTVVLLLALSNLGVNVNGLVASLGIGGIAVALAAQNILGDLFASLSIVFDKPFRVGDFIIVDDYLGNVRSIGMKTTRVKSLGGEEIVFANAQLLQSRIRNYKKMQERRVVFRFGVMYSTSAELLERISEIAKEAVEAQPDVRFDRAHFAAFGASSLDFEVVYHVLSPDYNVFMDRQEAINLRLFRQV
jgi:small-conductance mechanosensitive channel